MKVPKLGTVQDRVLRQFLTRESEKESEKVHLLALLVTNSIPFNDQAKSREWETKVKKIWSKYLGLEYGMEIPEFTDKEVEMQEYYMNKIRHLKPSISMGKDKKPIVTGLDSLMQ